jgi:anaerobic selenocysteine-containing dehydrogenase
MTKQSQRGNQSIPLEGVDRRTLLKTSALLGGTTALSQVACTLVRVGLGPTGEKVEYKLHRPDHQILTVCLQCNTQCPIRVKILDGVAVKMDGNPYSPQTMVMHLPYETPISMASSIDGAICPKGQSGIQTLYDPYRIVKVLKRAGRRGENRWVTIPFEQAIQEIVEGGLLFKNVPGEENRHVSGLKDIFKLRDPKLAKDMAEDAKKVGKGDLTVEAFKKKYRDHLDLLIDPDHPDLGPVNNQLVFMAGRIEPGRKEFSQRWLIGGFGSVNWYEHTTICEQSHHIAYARMTDPYEDGKWSGGKTHMKPDLRHSEFVILFGTSLSDANFGPPVLSALAMDRHARGELKLVVVDPRLNNTAGKAWKWLPIKPGGDGALAYGLIRWLLENEAYDRRYLENANKAPATSDNETTWTNATWLVRLETDGPGRFLRGSQIGMGDEHTFVVMRNGKPVPVRPYDTEHPVEGDLMFSGEVRGIRVKTAFQLLYEQAMSRKLEEWAELCGIPVEEIIEVAREFARHGKRSVAELYRGPVQHTNGYYNAQAIITLNLLMGNPDWKGGLTAGGEHWHEMGDKPGQPFPLKELHAGKLTAFGIKLTREGTPYEESTLFREKGYPAKRPWYPLSRDVYQEIIPSAGDSYPYPIKALFLHMATPALSIPGGQSVIQTLVDTEKIPLLVGCDIVIGDTTMYCDYIFPDCAIWERWGTPHQTPAVTTKASKIRQPAVDPLVEKVKVFGEELPICMETIMLAIAERLQMPGYGKDGFAPGMDFKRPEDFYLKMVANIAVGDKPNDEVPDASDAELELFLKARQHLSPAVFDPGKWEWAVIDAKGRNLWQKVVYVLNRGGRYENYAVSQKSGDKIPHPFGKMFSLYVERVALTRHSFKGKRFSGIALIESVQAYDHTEIADGEYPLQLITYKTILGGQSRNLPNNYWLANIFPENPILLNPRTARELGFTEGSWAQIVSATNPEGIWDLKNGKKVPIVGKIHLTEGIRPGVVAVSWHFGHWAYGASDFEIDRKRIPGDPRRHKGLCPNAAMRLDPALHNVCLSDPIGGSASFYDTRVKLLKVV